MYKIAICDDIDDTCILLENYISKYLNNQKLSFEIETFYDGEELISFMSRGNYFDLIFLDIEMKNKNGIEVSDFVRKKLNNHDTEIAFISGSDAYDRQLFTYQPLNFLSKPFKENLIIETINIFLKRNKTKIFFSYKVNTEINRVPISNILYFKSNNREITIYLTNKIDSFYGTLSNLSDQLKDNGFIAINRSVIVNFRKIKSINGSELTLTDDTVLSISRTKRDEVKNYLIKEMLS